MISLLGEGGMKWCRGNEVHKARGQSKRVKIGGLFYSSGLKL